jgi:hypothetical protein
MLRASPIFVAFVVCPVIAWTVASMMAPPPPTPANPATMPTHGPAAVDAHSDRAKNLVIARRYDEAAQEYVWLWDNMAVQAPERAGVRLSFTAAEMQQLADRHAAARAEFSALRDRTAKKLEKKPVDPLALLDWLTLSSTVLRDDAAVAELVARVKDDPEWAQAIEFNSDRIFDALVAQRRLAEAGAVIANPLEALRRMKAAQAEELEFLKSTRASIDGPVPGTAAKLMESTRARFRKRIDAMQAALEAAGREEEAAKFAEQAADTRNAPAAK